MLREHKKHDCIFKILDSAGELADRCDLPGNGNKHVAEASTSDRGFVGRSFANLVEAGRALHGEWEVGLSTLARMRADLVCSELPEPVSRRRRRRWSEDDGDEVCNDRLRSGQAFWRSTHRTRVPGQATRTIIVDVGANCQVPHLDILWRGAAAIVMAEVLERAGYAVEIWAVWHTRGVFPLGKTNSAVVAAQLKAPQDALDPSTLVNAVSGWFFRTAFFNEVCLTDRVCKTTLGRSTTMPREWCSELTSDDDFHLIADAWSYRDAVDLVRRQLRELSAGE